MKRQFHLLSIALCLSSCGQASPSSYTEITAKQAATLIKPYSNTAVTYNTGGHSSAVLTDSLADCLAHGRSQALIGRNGSTVGDVECDGRDGTIPLFKQNGKIYYLKNLAALLPH